MLRKSIRSRIKIKRKKEVNLMSQLNYNQIFELPDRHRDPV